VKFDNIDYSDLTKEEFHTKRLVDPLNPVYDIRDYAGYSIQYPTSKYRNPIKYGHVEGCHPKKLPVRASGELSKDLTTNDIPGAQASTRGLGPFAQKPRETFRNSLSNLDIEGAKVASMKNGNHLLYK
jgi:hypothetical protein